MVATSKPPRNKTRVRISKSGQITLPAEIRRQLGVEVGDQIEIMQDAEGAVTIRAFESLSISEFAGSLGPPPGEQSLTEYLRQTDRVPMVRSIYEKNEADDDSD